MAMASSKMIDGAHRARRVAGRRRRSVSTTTGVMALVVATYLAASCAGSDSSDADVSNTELAATTSVDVASDALIPSSDSPSSTPAADGGTGTDTDATPETDAGAGAVTENDDPAATTSLATGDAATGDNADADTTGDADPSTEGDAGTDTDADDTDNEGSGATPATTSAPTQEPGDANEVVDAAPQEELEPVDLDEESGEIDGISVEISDISRIDAEAELPGETGGPALLVTIELTNNGSVTADLSTVTVNLADAEGATSTPLTASPAAPFDGTLDADESATAMYVFSFPDDRVGPVTVDVSPAPELPVARFVGAIA